MEEKQYIDRAVDFVSKDLSIQSKTVRTVVELLDEGNTVPFIARYRKEQTGNLDETQIQSIKESFDYQIQLDQRKEEIIRLIDEQGKLTDELKKDIQAANKLQRLEDLYRPYKQKRRTRATIAKEKGLEPLAEKVWAQKGIQVQQEAEQYLSEENELVEVSDVLQGVNDILAEKISDEAKFREKIRSMTFSKGIIKTEIKKMLKMKKRFIRCTMISKNKYQKLHITEC